MGSQSLDRGGGEGKAGRLFLLAASGEEIKPVRREGARAEGEKTRVKEAGMISIQEIVREYLEKNGYDGLACPWAECGCKLSDLMPCGEPDKDECFAAHKTDDPEGEVEWLMLPGKAGEK
ncbi:MAG: hypothetical protein AB1585_13325 [Thermodesulfobacteriota bacterium]